MINYLIFNGQSSDVFGMVISGSGTYNAPKRKYDTFTVPGRNGTLKIDGGSFENISVTYTAAIVHNLNSNASAMREWLLSPAGYCRLEDTYHPGEFRLAQFSGGIDFSDFSQFLRAASFKLTFDCKPQRFLKAGENPISNPATVYNPTSFPAKPMIKFTAAAKSGNVVIGNCTITFDGLTAGNTVVMDAETMDAVNQSGENANSCVTISGDLVLLPQAFSAVSSEGVSDLTITPRWWTL